MSVIVVKNGVPDLLKAIKALTKNDVLVGIPDSGAERKPEAGEKKAPASNALIGYVLENGSPAKNIPPRPFLVLGVRDVKDKIAAQMQKGGVAVLSGDLKAIDATQHATGLIAQISVKNKIQSNIPPALAPRTLKERQKRGRTGTDTLVDTNQLLNSITYVVRPKGS